MPEGSSKTGGRRRRAKLEDVLRELRADVLGGYILPDARLPVDELCERYSVSAGTLREAVSRLVAEGLILSDRKGFRTAPVRSAEVADVMDTRELLEVHALDQAIRRGGVDWEAQVVAHHHILTLIEERARQGDEGWAAEWHRANRGFHMALMSACGSEWVMRFLGTLFDQTQRYGRQLLLDLETAAEFSAEHRELVEAVLARDREAAAAATRRHLEDVRRQMMRRASSGS